MKSEVIIGVFFGKNHWLEVFGPPERITFLAIPASRFPMIKKKKLTLRNVMRNTPIITNTPFRTREAFIPKLSIR